MVPDTHDALMELWAKGLVGPLVGAELPLTEAAAALPRLGDRGTVGTIVLLPGT